ncbi:hypothetical protein EDC14_105314 [Hydrogenispora ethanolica]|uniref:Uncharacterized protein n=1 Tax=Hydrogenispora ethanolica TaxID=1082276 RepID=A0A4R1QXK5_HYDET|nr:hypothetical protein EDC14_105314 [Hydrogenispora ethanolica]
MILQSKKGAVADYLQFGGIFRAPIDNWYKFLGFYSC